MPGLRKYTRWSLAAPALLLLLLLAVLATLQYRWLGQVSEGERERMRAGLRAGALRFGEDFDRELARAYVSFQITGEMMRGERWAEYAERVSRWEATAPYPRLVSEVLLVSVGESHAPRLRRFDRNAKRFEPAAWPPALEPLRRRSEQAAQSLSGGPPVEPVLMPPPFADDPPLLVIPVPELLFLGEGPADASRLGPLFRRRADNAFGQVVVVLDAAYIEKEFLPALARRYFAGGAGLDYHLRIASRAEPARVIYNTDPGARGQSTGADETVNLFSLRPEALDDFTLAAVVPASRPLHGPAIAPKALPGPAADTLLYAGGEALWQLTLRHRDGSLNGVVARTRRRNILISFSILLVLAGSVALMMISAQRAQRLARQQVEFVAGVSHELRTPVAVVRSLSENMADGLVKDEGRFRRYGELMKKESGRLAEMIEQILDFAGTQAAGRAYHLTPVDAREVVEGAVAACRLQSEAGGFRIEVVIERALPPVMAEPRALGRALQNLLGNAMKYSGESRWVRVSAGARAGEVFIAVEDRGRGIEPEDFPHLFEPFRRGRAAVEAQIHGNGIGLSLVRRIVAAHGGRVEVQSVPGSGSTFTLRLPAAPTASQAPASAPGGSYEQANTAC